VCMQQPRGHTQQTKRIGVGVKEDLSVTDYHTIRVAMCDYSIVSSHVFGVVLHITLLKIKNKT